MREVPFKCHLESRDIFDFQNSSRPLLELNPNSPHMYCNNQSNAGIANTQTSAYYFLFFMGSYGIGIPYFARLQKMKDIAHFQRFNFSVWFWRLPKPLRPYGE